MSIPKQVISSLIISGLITLGIIKWQKEVQKKKESEESLMLNEYESEKQYQENYKRKSGYPPLQPNLPQPDDPIINTIEESNFGATVEQSESSTSETQTAGQNSEKPNLMELLKIDTKKIEKLKDDPNQLKEYLDDCILLAVNDPAIEVSMKEIRKLKNDLLYEYTQ